MSKVATILQSITLTIALVCVNVAAVSADVVDIKSDAPTQYVVQKGDTLWDISSLFLDQPWLWPELWRNNVQIENPHLIYPGDTLRLRYDAQGQPVIDIVRDKSSVVLSPDERVINKPNPISLLPWSHIASFIGNDSMLPKDAFNKLPALLGDNKGSPLFSDKDYVLTHKLADSLNTTAQYQVVRKVREVLDSNGNSLGVQLTHLSSAEMSNGLSEDRQVVRLVNAKQEARQGDRIMPATSYQTQDLSLSPASAQTGELVENMNGNVLIGKRDFVIINLGENDVKPGTIFGIYQQGPNVKLKDSPEYSTPTNDSILDWFSFNDEVEQPAYKVGELIVVRSFENASYAWVTKANTHLRGGELIAKP